MMIEECELSPLTHSIYTCVWAHLNSTYEIISKIVFYLSRGCLVPLMGPTLSAGDRFQLSAYSILNSGMFSATWKSLTLTQYNHGTFGRKMRILFSETEESCSGLIIFEKKVIWTLKSHSTPCCVNSEVSSPSSYFRSTDKILFIISIRKAIYNHLLII